MKRLMLLVFLLGFVGASVDVHSFDSPSEYPFLGEVRGSVNLTVDKELYDEEIVVSYGSGISFGDFLVENDAEFNCFPEDCSAGYSFSSGALEDSAIVSLFEDGYIGFVLYGKDVVLSEISFDVSSDFGKESNLPLAIEFFEGEEWRFSNFSDELSSKRWGCYDSSEEEVGPLIGNSYYCEMIELGDGDVLRVGAKVDDSEGEGNLTMNVYTENGGDTYWDCEFDPAVDDGCFVSFDGDEMVDEGMYQICIKSSTLSDYRIFEDVSGDACGFVHSDGPSGSVKDYAIYAQGVKYDNANAIGDLDFSGRIDSANAFIIDRYGGNCSDGCVLPLRISGVSQNFSVRNVDLVYTDAGEWESDDLVYVLEKTSAAVSYDGELDLGFLGIVVSSSGEYFATLSGVDLFRIDVSVLPAPLISSVSPLEVPAGVPVSFFANVVFDENKSLVYNWDFGDGKKERSDVNHIGHTYGEIGNYSLSLKVSVSGGVGSERSFEVEVVNPEEAVVSGLSSKRAALDKVKADISSIGGWYSSDLIDVLELDSIEFELDRLEDELADAFVDEDYVKIAVDLFGLNVPVGVRVNEFESPFFMTTADGVDIDAVLAAGGGSGDYGSEYVNAILVWQEENIDILSKRQEVFVSYEDGTGGVVFSVYDIDLTSSSYDESYFIIDKPISELYFKGDSGVSKAGGSSAIVLDGDSSESFEFYYEGDSDGNFFVSPRLSSLVVEGDISSDCNFNLICEENLGENSDVCRSDCKPVSKAFSFFIVGLLVLLVIYTALQIWYKKHYEAYLFKDSAQMYNLLMYISNARARGLGDKRIASDLKERGWSGERVNYAIRKSLGKSVGMVEIIPIERVSAWLRNRKARKNVSVSSGQVGLQGGAQGFRGQNVGMGSPYRRF